MTAVPRLTVTGDNEFFFEGCRRGELRIQKCGDCEALRHPPTPVCPHCRSAERSHIVASGAATLHSYTVVHHPKDDAFDYPLAVGLVDLPEGTRFVADIAGIDPENLTLGMRLRFTFTEHAHGEILPTLVPDTGIDQENTDD
ncbi:Zn-ribbon domain-containing OB-fold protein [Gordonia neofelifaecis]|uniref:DUF35 domain-containing protein n=1 Tax=Gordonia neofelifaecis NRRL B-59395 TaxID=644548 RepID=F1YNV5_9ACTN|nr:OB-fold domain-containing protein [Gordonia neofelifaecis]EGD53574.1 hypothetical protein SCNU_18022 [Gordonia neofelifaecis NRRL B-59395]